MSKTIGVLTLQLQISSPAPQSDMAFDIQYVGTLPPQENPEVLLLPGERAGASIAKDAVKSGAGGQAMQLLVPETSSWAATSAELMLSK